MTRKQMIKALACCVDVLATMALVESCSAIKEAMKCKEVWKHVDSHTREILINGMGYKDPEES